MFSSSTQRKFWTFVSKEELQNKREETNKAFCTKYQSVVESDQLKNDFLSVDEEVALCQLVMETGRRFYKDFQVVVM